MLRQILVVTLLILAQDAAALKSDRDKPATVEADEVEYDFKTGKRAWSNRGQSEPVKKLA